MYQHSYGYFNIISHCLKWKIARLIWIAFYKNKENQDCLMQILPKDIIHHIFQFLTNFAVYNGNNLLYDGKDTSQPKFITLKTDLSHSEQQQTYKTFKFDQKRLNGIVMFATLALVCAVALRLLS